jgi:hypothetical protein|tara:strand:- start:147 stop:671 length:525 start_codon:yes stop_codon:yes gene_type:complete
MTRSLSKKRVVKPPLDRFGGVRIVQKRIQKSEIIDHSKDAVAQELVDIATASIDEIVNWDSSGYVSVKTPEEISDRAIKAIKKIKMTPTKEGPQLEVELHDKVSVLRTLARATGMLDKQDDMDKPSVVGIVMHGPDQIIDVEPVNEIKKDGVTRDTDSSEGDAEQKDKSATGSE